MSEQPPPWPPAGPPQHGQPPWPPAGQQPWPQPGPPPQWQPPPNQPPTPPQWQPQGPPQQWQPHWPPQQAPTWIPQQPGQTPWGAAPPPFPPGAGPGWTPPPRPGLLPLRPLTLGEVIGISFRAMRRNPLPTIGFALLASAIGSVVVVLPVILLAVFGGFGDESGDGVPVGALVTLVASYAALLTVQLVVASLLQGIVAVDVARGAVGQRLRLRGIFARLRGRMLRLLGWTIALGLAAGIVVGVIALVVVLISFGVGGAGGVVAGILIGLIGLLGLAAAGAWIGTKTSFTASAIVIERLGIRAAVVRSWRLTTGRFWPILGTTLLVNMIYSTAGQVVSYAVQFVGSMLLGVVIGPNASDPGTVITAVLVFAAVAYAVAITVGALAQVAAAVTATTLYLDARMRREGFDMELRRFTEATAAGREDVADPFDAAGRGM